MPKDKPTHEDITTEDTTTEDMATEFVELVKHFALSDDFLSDNSVWPERLQEIATFLPKELTSDLVDRMRTIAHEQSADIEAFSRIHDLTKAEEKLLISLAAGLSVPAHSKKLGISVNTGRVHMQRILDKTAASGQLDLMKMLHKH